MGVANCLIISGALDASSKSAICNPSYLFRVSFRLLQKSPFSSHLAQTKIRKIESTSPISERIDNNMYCDLYLPFPISTPGAGPSNTAISKKGKAKAVAAPVQSVSRSCWEGLTQKEKEDADKTFAMAGHCKCGHVNSESRATNNL